MNGKEKRRDMKVEFGRGAEVMQRRKGVHAREIEILAGVLRVPVDRGREVGEEGRG